MAVFLSPVFGVAGQLFDNNGNPLAGGKIFTYLAGTTTPAATYTNSLGSIAHSNPIVLDGAGRVPSGEIWLTDGITYKFVVEDSASNLIGTYDNITGINSNFVAFTNSQEIQTATAGQTVFNLTTMQYQPGTNSLSVFVDGVNQYGPGAQFAYVETDADTVTFVSGLHVGASVKFTTSQLNTSGAIDAAQVSYQPPFVDSVATNVEAKLSQYVSVIDFGADPTGVADSSTAIQNALDSGVLEILFPSGSYLLNSVLTLSPLQKIVGEQTFLVIGNPLCGAGTANNTPIITMAERSSISGFIFKTQTQPVINSITTAPVVHPYCIGVNNCSYTTIQNVDFLACWRGVVAGNSAPHECMTIQNMRGTIFETPVYIDQNTDVDRLLDIQLNPTYAVYYGGAGNFVTANIVAYQRNTANANAFTIRKSDWLQMNNCFVYGYKRGMLLESGTATISGPPTVSVSNSGFDGCENCIVSSNVINASFDNVTMAALQLASETVRDVFITGAGSFQFTNCFLIGNTFYGMVINTSGSVSVTNCQITDHYEGITVSNGRINLDSVIFKQAGGTLYDINLSGTANGNIRNCRRYDGSASVNNGVTATTCPKTYENGGVNYSYLPFFAAVGAASSQISPTSIADTATHYFATLPAGDGTYLVYAGQDASTNGVYRAIALVRTGSSSAAVSVLANNGITIAVSGLQVGVTNSAGGALDVSFGYLKLYEE